MLGLALDTPTYNQCCLAMYLHGAKDNREHVLWIAQAPGESTPAAGGGNAGSLNAAGEDVLAEVSFDGGFRVPGRIYNRLFDYQKTGKTLSVLCCPYMTSSATMGGHDKLAFKSSQVSPCAAMPSASIESQMA